MDRLTYRAKYIKGFRNGDMLEGLYCISGINNANINQAPVMCSNGGCAAVVCAARINLRVVNVRGKYSNTP